MSQYKFKSILLKLGLSVRQFARLIAQPIPEHRVRPIPLLYLCVTSILDMLERLSLFQNWLRMRFELGRQNAEL